MRNKIKKEKSIFLFGVLRPDSPNMFLLFILLLPHVNLCLARALQPQFGDNHGLGVEELTQFNSNGFPRWVFTTEPQIGNSASEWGLAETMFEASNAFKQVFLSQKVAPH